MHDILIPAVVLIITTLGGLAFAAAIAKKVGWISFRVIAVLNYIVVYLVSGIVHLINTSASRRGYFDAVQTLDSGEMDQVLLATTVGFVSLCVGTLVGLPTKPLGARRVRRIPPFYRSDRVLLTVLSVIVLPLSLFSLIKVRDYASTLDTYGGRIISVSDGFGRYSYLAAWTVWAITFVVILIARSSKSGNERRTGPGILLLVSGGALAIIAATGWSGGRSTFINALPLLLVMLPLLKVNKWAVAGTTLAVAAGLSIYVSQVTGDRFSRSRLGTSGPLDWLDWEWGRFSQVGFAVRYTNDNGFLLGETFIKSIDRFFEGIFRLAGLTYTTSEARSAMEVAGEEILRTSALHIVPGIAAEFYLNFGMIGIVIGFFIIGRICGVVDLHFDNSSTVITQLFWAFLGTLCAIRAMIADSGSPLLYLTYSGAPLVFAALLSYLMARNHAGGDTDQTLSNQLADHGVSVRNRVPQPVNGK